MNFPFYKICMGFCIRLEKICETSNRDLKKKKILNKIF